MEWNLKWIHPDGRFLLKLEVTPFSRINIRPDTFCNCLMVLVLRRVLAHFMNRKFIPYLLDIQK